MTQPATVLRRVDGDGLESTSPSADEHDRLRNEPGLTPISFRIVFATLELTDTGVALVSEACGLAAGDNPTQFQC